MAPSFDVARRELYAQLTQWTYAHLTRPCSVPPATARDERDPYPYFHGTAVTKEHQRIWFKRVPVDQAARMPTLRLGGLSVHPPEETYVPGPGDVLAGKVEQVTRSRPPGKEGKEQNDRFSSWYGPVNYLQSLLTLVCNGTELSEAQLAHELRIRRPYNQGVDDAWALARIVLFGNVDVFAKQHMNTLAAERPMRLSTSPLEFVYNCAHGLDDDSIWQAFVKLVPDARPPVVREDAVKVAPLMMPPMQTAPSSYSPVRTHRTHHAHHSAPYPPRPRSPPFYAQPPPSPPHYVPQSPPHYVPQSPPQYAPEPQYVQQESPRFIGRQQRRAYTGANLAPPMQSAKYTPRSPGYTPQSPGYTPRSPGYTPQSPGYTPRSPGYTPRSPGYTPESPGYTPHPAANNIPPPPTFETPPGTPPPNAYDPMYPAYDDEPPVKTPTVNDILALLKSVDTLQARK